MTSHPQYRLTYSDGVGMHVSSDVSHYGPRTLDAAVDKAARMNLMSKLVDAGLLYGIEPIPGTEPRYWLACNADIGSKLLVSSWHPGDYPLAWPEAVAAWQYALEHSSNPPHWRALVSA